MTPQELFVDMVLRAWNTQLSVTNALLNELSDEQLMREVSPGRNRGIYLLGHLTAEHDRVLPLLRFRDALYPGLQKSLIEATDRAEPDLPTRSQLRAQWKEVNEVLMDHINRLPAKEWFTRHTNISEADFFREPHRNRLNVLITRTVHLAHHHGQLVLLRGK